MRLPAVGIRSSTTRDAGPDRPDRVYSKRGGFVDEYAEVDPLAFGIMPDSVPGAEPDQLLALRVAADAIADAGGRSGCPAAIASVSSSAGAAT